MAEEGCGLADMPLGCGCPACCCGGGSEVTMRIGG